MKIKNFFVRPIDRPINGVIKADQHDVESIWQELDEYVVTKQITDYLRRFFDAYLATANHPTDPTIVARMGVWVSGFFGSGKSHFIKILSYLLGNIDARGLGSGEHRKAVQFFETKIQDPMLMADIRRAVASDTDVILFNIDSKADSKADRDAILQVFLRVFNEMQGLSGDAPHVAEMERYLISKGKYEQFKFAFKEKHGSKWEAERDAVDFLRDEVVHALGVALGMSEESAAKWFDDARESYKINIEKFAKLVSEYLDTKRAGHRVIFLVDEVGQFIGKNTQLMLNLQTITEELGTLCRGRAWVIVTSQEDIDAAIGEANQARSNDFSKITGRFHTRLALSSSNTDEVISRRLLEKLPEARAELLDVWAAKGDIINNQLSFANNSIALRGFKDAEDFAAHYPFVPYQFQLLQKIFESIRKVGATGRHLARGERSMLDAFQTAALINGDRDASALIPLYDFYPSIESFLDSSVKRAIDQAAQDPALEPYDSNLLRALFLVRYIPDTVKASIENLATLCVTEIDADKLALKRQIESSLARLERQNLVSRNGDFWYFLTNEERDVSQEIKSVEVSASEITRLVSELVFDEILSGQSKVRHRETKSDYEFNRLLDGAPWRQANQELTFEVLSPLGPEYDLLTEARCIGRSAEGSGRALLRMAADVRIDVELRTYLQIEKYIIGPKADAANPSLKRILHERKDENRERRSRLVHKLSELMSAGDFYALGQKLQFKALVPSSLLDEIVNYLISNTYTKLTYIKVRQADPIAEIRAVLSADTIGQRKILLDGEEGNAAALVEMRQYLSLAASSTRVLLSDITEKFGRAPWGWKPEWETVLLIARLFMAGELKLVLEGSDLDPRSAIEPLTKPARLRQVSVLKRKTSDSVTRTKARELHRELFSMMAPEDEDGLVSSYRANLLSRRAELDEAKHQAGIKGNPGLRVITTALTRIDKQLAIRDPFEFLATLVSDRREWLDAADEWSDVLSFYKTQVGVWSRMLDAMRTFADNREALAKDSKAAAAITELEAISSDPAPYGNVRLIEDLVARVDVVNKDLVSDSRSKALLSIEAKITEAKNVLESAQADAGLSDRVLRPLQDLKIQVSNLVSVPRIAYLAESAGNLLDDAMMAIGEAIKSKRTVSDPQGASAVNSAMPVAEQTQLRPVTVVRAAQLSSKSYLESEADVQDYAGRLKAELIAIVSSGRRVRLQ